MLYLSVVTVSPEALAISIALAILIHSYLSWKFSTSLLELSEVVGCSQLDKAILVKHNKLNPNKNPFTI